MRIFKHQYLALAVFAFLGAAHTKAQTSQNAGLAQAASMASVGQGAMGTGMAASDCLCKMEAGSTCQPTFWSCATLPLQVLSTLASLMDAGQNGQQQAAVTDPNTDSGSNTSAGAVSSIPTSTGGNSTLGLTTPSSTDGGSSAASAQDTPFATWAPQQAQQICGQTPDAFLCQSNPAAAIDALKDTYQKAYDAGALGGTGTNGLPPGETLAGALASFDKAKEQLSAMMANTDAFKKGGKNANANTAGSGTQGVGGNAIVALKDSKTGPTGFGGAPAKYFIENGLEIIDENSGRPLTLWQRATNRYKGTHSERLNTLARMEQLRQNALNYLKGNKASVNVMAAKNVSVANDPLRSPASSTKPENKAPTVAP